MKKKLIYGLGAVAVIAIAVVLYFVFRRPDLSEPAGRRHVVAARMAGDR